MVGFGLVIPIMIMEVIESIPWLPVLSRKTLSGSIDLNSDLGTIIGAMFYMSFIEASLTEETAKFLCCFLLKSHQPTITKPYTIVILITSSALGFAIFENFSYIITSALKGDIIDLLLEICSRALLSVPLHSITGVLIGCKMAQQYIQGASITFKFYFQTIAIPILIHGLFDVFAFLSLVGGYWQFFISGNIILVLLGVYLAYRNISLVKSVPELLPL